VELAKNAHTRAGDRVWVPRSSVDHRIALHARCHLHAPPACYHPAVHLRATLQNPFVVGALQASQGLGRDWIPLRPAKARWIPWPVAKEW